MDMKLTGKRALVTGSTGGIGFGIAVKLLDEGVDVIINGRDVARTKKAAEQLRSSTTGSGLVYYFVGDLAQSSARRALALEFPSIDILVNNLGVYSAKSADALVDEDFMDMFNTNVVSGAALSKQYMQGMKARNWGRIIFIASEVGMQVPADMIHYGVSKAAQIALSRGLAETTAGTGVTVNAVLPGPTLTDGVKDFLNSLTLGESSAGFDAKQREFVLTARPSSLLQRFATVEEVANLVTYVASPLSSATNGAALRVEGGLLRHAF
jgi:NAD(P)-dependent dehydrogenase (short-subunit alcohol dehydrogenase family)